jgi:hypothetical protein
MARDQPASLLEISVGWRLWPEKINEINYYSLTSSGRAEAARPGFALHHQTEKCTASQEKFGAKNLSGRI